MMFFTLLKFELLQSWRRYTDVTHPLWFLILITCIFAIGLQQDVALLQKAAPGIIWCSVILAMMLSVNQLFLPDYHSGALEHMILSPTPLITVVWIKIIAYWIKTCLPILLCVPILGAFLHLSFAAISIILLSLFLGTPTLILLGALGAALTIRLNNNALLLTLLILPLSIPVLIFGLSVSAYASFALAITTPICFLAALFIGSAVLLPIAIAFSLRIGINS